MQTTKRNAILWIAGSCVLGLGATSHGASHLWRFQEVFSNADGSIQFIEMKECCGAPNETFLDNKWVRSDLVNVSYVFPNNLPCSNCTANKHLLLATQSFADLPGAPTPDFIIPPNIFSLSNAPHDTLRYWLYTDATWTFDLDVPTDGVHSLVHPLSLAPDFVAVNSPTNFAGQTGSVVVPCNPADIVIDGTVNVSDLLAVIGAWGACGDPSNCPADIAPPGGNDQVNIDDLLAVISAWGQCD
ncbi:MAG: hypothetical protein L0219_22420 [Phycisphaerales bacterium]|nr:hypothetical protein [Phycisphaerales bacterium]